MTGDRPDDAPTIGPFRALGHRFVIECTDEAIAQRLSRVYEPLTARGSWDARYRLISRPDERWIDVWINGERIAHVDDPCVAEEHLIWTVNQRAIESWPGVLLHGGVVRSPAGRGVAILGRSGAGKSTLVAALLQEGYAYLSDELVPVDAKGQVVAHPRAISLRRGSWHLLAEDVGVRIEPRSGEAQLHVDAVALAAETAERTGLDVVAILCDEPTAGQSLTYEAQETPQGLAAVCEHAFGLDHITRSDLLTLRSVVGEAAVLTVRGGTVPERTHFVKMSLRAVHNGP